MRQIKGQISITEYLSSLEEAAVCNHSGHTCNKSELWRVADTLDMGACPHVCCRSCNVRLCGARCNGSEVPDKDDLPCEGCIHDVNGCCNYDEPLGDYCVLGDKAVYKLDIRGICDDPYCPKCGHAFWTESYRSEIDCERCPECDIRVDWTLWHKINDEPSPWA